MPAGLGVVVSARLAHWGPREGARRARSRPSDIVTSVARSVVNVRWMAVLAIVAVSAPVSGCGADHGERSAIAHGIRAPLADFMRRDASAFCSDFTPAVAARLGGGQACKPSVEHVFAIIKDTIE